MPMSNIYYWSHSLDNPEPEGLEEEPYIHDEYIAGLLSETAGNVNSQTSGQQRM
jgi:hypothetical protein